MTYSTQQPAHVAARALLARNLKGEKLAITSVCSAHPQAILAACKAAEDAGQIALIEATCNQVNHEGGYTGMQPTDFVALVRDAADQAGLPEEQLLLGGDHLGPQPWRNLDAETAMAKAEAMVDAYVRAGFKKIHLDCSMRCGDDPEILEESVMAQRAARLAKVAEAAAGDDKPFYIVGSEVPPPGGMGEGHEIDPTNAGRVLGTIEAHRSEFAKLGLDDAFDRVVGIVVQPGLDFGNDTVVHFDPAAAQDLVDMTANLGGLVYEAHSTDYQRPLAYQQLVERHFAILKVGPAVTFALREALYALEAIEAELAFDKPSKLREIMEDLMVTNPKNWDGHYHGDEATKYWLRHFSWSDRIRYYWTAPEAKAAVARLEANLDAGNWPLPLVSQYLPDCANLIASGDLPMTCGDVISYRVAGALKPYYAASKEHN